MSAKTTSRRAFLKAAAGTVGAGALAATGLQAGVQTAAAAATGATRLKSIEPQGVLWGLNYQPHVEAYQRLATLFKKQTGSTLTVQPQPFPLDTKLIASIASGTEPDVCCILANQSTSLAIQQALMPLNSSVYKSNHINIAQDFVGDAVEAFTFHGSIYGVPVETDGNTGSIINVPVGDVKKAGLASKYPPSNGQWNFNSYDDVYALAKALQVKKNGKVTRWGLCGEGWDDKTFWGIMLTLGTKPFDPQTKTFHFNSPAGVQAMRYHVEIPVKMGIETEWNDASACVDEALNGKAAVTIGNDVPSTSINASHGYTYQMAGVPKINGKAPVLSGTGDGWGFVMPAKARHPNLATAFLRMMATRAGQFQYDLIYGGLLFPAWTDIMLHDTARFSPRNDTNPAYLVREQWSKFLPSVQHVGEVGYYPKVSAAIAAACQGVREGKLTAQHAVAQIQAQAEAQYRQYQNDLANL